MTSHFSKTLTFYIATKSTNNPFSRVLLRLSLRNFICFAHSLIYLYIFPPKKYRHKNLCLNLCSAKKSWKKEILFGIQKTSNDYEYEPWFFVSLYFNKNILCLLFRLLAFYDFWSLTTFYSLYNRIFINFRFFLWGVVK